MNRLRLALSTAVTVATLSPSPSALALGPVTLEVAATVGAGANPGLVTSPFGFTVGGRAGVVFHDVYGGVTGAYSLGTTASDATVNAGTTEASAVTLHGAVEGIEVGYTFGTPLFKVRPLLGLGNSTIYGRSWPPGTVSTYSFDNVYVEPGVLLMVPLRRFFVGADSGVMILPRAMLAPLGYSTATSYASFAASGQVGVRF